MHTHHNVIFICQLLYVCIATFHAELKSYSECLIRFVVDFL